MNKSDVLFLNYYESIRDDWTGDIVERIGTMRRLLPQTTLSDEIKKWFKEHLSITEEQLEDTYFDGRTFARDSEHSYNDLRENRNWFDGNYYTKHSIDPLEDPE